MSNQDPYDAQQPAAGQYQQGDPGQPQWHANQQDYGNQHGYGNQEIHGYGNPQGHGNQQSYGQSQGYGNHKGYGNQQGYGTPQGYGYGNPQGYGPPQGYGHHGMHQYSPYRGGTQPGVPVGFVEAIKRFYAKYTQFSGRASRSEYWWVALYLGVLYLVLSLLMAAGTNAYGEPNAFGILVTLVLVVFALGHIVPSIALGVRRLHDVNLSGWFYLLGLIPYVGGLVLVVFAVLPPKPEGARFDR